MKYLLLLIIFAFPAHAEMRIITLDRSWHYFDEDNKYNDKHGGIGLEVTDGARSYSLIHYTNSYNGESWLFSTERDGWVTGFATGYDHIDIFPFAAYQITMFKYLRVTFTPVVAYSSIVIPFR